MKTGMTVLLIAYLSLCGLCRAQATSSLPDGFSIEPLRIAPPLFRPHHSQFSQAIHIRSMDTAAVVQVSLRTDAPWLRVQPDEQEIRPDETAAPVVHIDVRELRSGRHTGSVILTSADWVEPVSIPVFLDILAPIAPSPATVVLYEDGTLRQSFLTLYSEPDLSYSLSGIQTPGFLDVVPGRMEVGRRSFTLRLKEGVSPSTLHDAGITFVTDSTLCPEIHVPVRILPPPDYEELYRARRENRPVRNPPRSVSP